MNGVTPKVIHVAVTLEPGGLERLVVRWTQRRNGRCSDSTVVCCLDGPGTLAAHLPAGTVVALEAERGRNPWDRDAVRRLRRLARERGVKVLHSHNLAAQQYAVLAAMGAGLRVVLTEHGSRPPPNGLVRRVREYLLNRLTDRIAAVSGTVAERFAGRAVVIPNGVSPHEPASAERKELLRQALGLPAGRPAIGYVGRLAAIKGVDRLVRAFGQMAAEGETQAVLLLVGDGPDRDRLKSEARAVGIEDRVVFAGFRDDARGCYDLMDCFVLPSRSEGLPVALLEAMAAGVPALATDVGANREVLLNGEAGTLLPEDCGQWPALLHRAIGHDVELSRKAERGREHVAKHYSEAATAEAYERVYESA
jgi:glycosyltransferase involved in cell wall biosynthesis